jgi:hypothetical protein
MAAKEQQATRAGHPDADILYFYEGRWYDWEGFFWARVNRLLPPREKPKWGRR